MLGLNIVGLQYQYRNYTLFEISHKGSEYKCQKFFPNHGFVIY